MSAAVTRGGFAAIVPWSGGPSPIRSVSSSSANVLGADAAGARETLARIRDLVNTSLDAYGDNDDDNDGDDDAISAAAAAAALDIDLDASSASRAGTTVPPLRRVVVIPTQLPAPPPRVFRDSVFSPASFNDDPAHALAALRVGIGRALALLPTVGEISELGGQSRTSNTMTSTRACNVPIFLRPSRALSLPPAPAVRQTNAFPFVSLTQNSLSQNAPHNSQNAQNSLSQNDSSLSSQASLSLLDNSHLGLGLGLSVRDADISRLENRVEELFAQVKDAARRAHGAAADAQEALRRGEAASSSHRAAAAAAAHDAGSPLHKQSRLEQQHAAAAAALDASAEAAAWLAGGGEGGVEAAAPPAVVTSAASWVSLSQSRDSRNKSRSLLSHQSLRAAAQRSSDARRATPLVAPPPPPPAHRPLRPFFSRVAVYTPYGSGVGGTGMRHGSWVPSRWAQEVDGVTLGNGAAGRKGEGAQPRMVCAPPILHRIRR